MAEEATQEPKAETQPIPEPVEIPLALEPIPELVTEPQMIEPSPTAQPVEPLNPEPQQAGYGVGPEPVSEPQLMSESSPEPSPSVPAPEPIQAPEPVIEPEPQPVPQPEPAQPIQTPEPILPPQPVPNTPNNSASASSQPSPEVTARQADVTRQELLKMARASIQSRKRKKLEKIMEFLSTTEIITNDKVEKLLHVSDATATRYMEQLEKEGKVKQNGTTGRSVSYSRI